MGHIPTPDKIEVSWWGSTTENCSLGPDDGQWRLLQSKTFNDATNVSVTATGAQPRKVDGECDNTVGPPFAWYVTFNVNKPANASQHWWFQHQLSWYVCASPTLGAPEQCH